MKKKMHCRKKRIGILGVAKGPQVQIMSEVLKKLGTEVILIDPKRLTSFLPQSCTLYTENDASVLQLEELDALLVRSLPGGSLEQVIYRVNVLHRLEMLGLKVINSASLIEKTVDKFFTSAILAAAGLPVPRTIVTERFDQAIEAVGELGSVVVKPVFGSLGKGIVLVEDLDIAHRVFRALEMGRYIYYLQEFLPNGNEDLRIFVIGGKVVGAMRRRGSGWKTNIACGSRAEVYQPEKEIARMAVQTAKLLKADYLGVDILISNDTPYVIEANGIPGWTGLQSVSETDIAAALAEYTLEEIKKH
ncbi:ATP-grasp domain-containing protein [Desulfoscipio sp. XC116]|uniref:ATP-grasp domain-containing protein n=1 Tax=Desulfoscipio sp. XC116 TaxID=3144975 RepID=UPI00325BFC47